MIVGLRPVDAVHIVDGEALTAHQTGTRQGTVNAPARNPIEDAEFNGGGSYGRVRAAEPTEMLRLRSIESF